METADKQSYKVSPMGLTSLSVYNVGRHSCAPSYQWGPGIRNHYLIHAVVRGKGVYRTETEEYTLLAGDVFLVYPNTTVSYTADETDPWEYCWAGFNGSDALRMLEASGFRPDAPVLRNLPYAAELQDMLMGIYRSRGGTLAHSVEMTGRLYILLSLFLRNPPVSDEADLMASYTRQAMDYIHGHYSYPLLVEDIAAHIGISRSHLYRAFCTVTGKRPKTYLTEYRIQQACALLGRKDLSIAAIAQSVGYEDGMYFSKVFHKVKHVTPTEYAARVRQAQTGEPTGEILTQDSGGPVVTEKKGEQHHA
jgi:AraC-like DNA-binding protein